MRRLLETASLFVLVAVVALRPLIAESYDSAGSTLTMALGAVNDPRPLHTLLIDLAILLACLGWAAAHALTGRDYRKTGMEWGLLLIAVAAAASCFVAGNKRLAINATIDWLTMAALGLVLAQLVRTAWHRWLLLGAVIASATAQSAQCLDQAFGFDETWAHYASIREEFWGKQGVPLDSSKVEQFERRMQAREASGFLQHSNAAGSHLVLVGLPALGAFLAFLRRRLVLQANLTALVLGTIAVALILTKSRGAMVAGGAGLALYGMIRLAASWPAARRWRAVCALWVMIALGIAAIVGYGWWKGTLPDASMAFRWEYWTTSLAMLRRFPLTGVGRENFGRHYTQFKSIESPEEIANPHNLLVQAGCEWGIVGALGLVVMIVGWSFRAATSEPEASAAERGKPAGGHWIAWGVGLAVVMTLVRVPLLGSSDSHFLYYASMVAGLAWVVGFVAVASAVSLDQDLRFPRAAVLAGVGAFLIHDLINFALWVPGTATTFFAVTALAVGGDGTECKAPVARRSRWLPAAGVIVAILLVLIFGVIPVARVERRMTAATTAPLVRGALQTQPALALFEAASRADPFDPLPHAARAEWLVAYAQAAPGQGDAAQRGAIEALGAAIRRDPINIGLWRRRTHVRLAVEGSGSRVDYQGAIDDARRALSLYPASPADWVLLADTLAQAGEALSSAEMLQEAALHYVHAFQLDERRPAWETIRRLRPGEKAAIEDKLRKTRELLEGH